MLLLKSQADEGLSLLEGILSLIKGKPLKDIQIVFLKIDKQLDPVILLQAFKFCVQGNIANLSY